LRSIRDGSVFDLIPIVAARYLNGQGRKDLEVWKSTRRVRSITAGSTLRVIDAGVFRLRWSVGDGHLNEMESTPSGLGLSYVDLPTQAGQTAPLRFTFAGSDTALPADTVFEVEITSTPPQQ
jgi:glucoamylase